LPAWSTASALIVCVAVTTIGPLTAGLSGATGEPSVVAWIVVPASAPSRTLWSALKRPPAGAAVGAAGGRTSLRMSSVPPEMVPPGTV
jgi:hypothetical protein